MRKSFVTLLLLVGAVAMMASPVFAAVEDLGGGMDLKLYNAKNAQNRQNPGGLGTSVGTTDPETIWVGFWSGANPANNYYYVGGLPAGSGNRPPAITDGLWTWDGTQISNATWSDSMSGWHSLRDDHTNFSGATLTDEQRPWWNPDFGNKVNHAFNPGSGSSRTFGVIGVWHVDGGNTVTSGGIPAPNWAPLAGSSSAYMGLRAYGDMSYVDAETNNPFNGEVALYNGIGGAASPGAADVALPGYFNKMDQLLYRDIDMSGYGGGGLDISFDFRTNMSTNKWTTDRFRTGWYEGDGLSQNAPTPGNFVSAEADNGAGPSSAAPIDSFQVYIGAPVEGEWKTSVHPFDGDPQLVSLGVINPATGRRVLQDPQRRWFNEIVQKDARLWLYGAFGNNAPATVNLSIPDAAVQALLDSANADGFAATDNKLRLVFRVHTNGSESDQAGSVAGNYNSGNAGAAVLDAVTVDETGGGNLLSSGFEATSEIDNDTGVAAVDAWKSTGKPPQAFFHPHDISTLTYQDICGPVGSANRICDMEGVVISMGIHDKNEASSDPAPLSADHEGNWGMVSPAINFAGADQSSKDGTKNNMNMSASERFATDDYYIWYEIYTGVFDVFGVGQIWQFGFQSYPAQQADGTLTWGPITLPSFLYFNPEKQCAFVLDGGFTEGLIRTSNPNGVPDSMRIYLRKLSQCYRFGITTGCSPTDGAYYDNAAVAVVDGVPQLIGIGIWDLYNDAFPANENPGLPGTAGFDTAAAHVKIGLNVAQTTSDLFRYNVPGDSLVITAAGDSVRMDLLFRIDLGVGNYNTVGDRSSGLRSFPVGSSPNPNGTSFLSAFATSPGPFSGVGGGINPGAAIAAHAGAPSGWSSLVWNSARLDSSEVAGHNVFPVQGLQIGNPPSGQEWSGTYHEEDGKYNTLGISKNRCFVIDTTNTDFIDANTTCGNGTFPPAYIGALPNSYTGYNGSATTVEGTKIIPDGLLTPGAHVQYFVRRQDLENPTSIFAMLPDTNVVSPQGAEGPNTDGHRWQQFGVLPDRWKEPAFGGAGMACMLFYDNNDRRGNERVWKGVADSIGATGAGDIGNADGYGGVPGGTSVNSAAYRLNKNRQMGTTWDAFQMKASESLTTGAARIGGRLGYRGIATSPGGASMGTAANGKWSYLPPTLDMLNTYYTMMLVVTGDLNSGVWGPFNDATADDITTFQSWLQAGDTGTPDRGILVIGESFVEFAFGAGGAQQSYVTDFLATTFQDPNYLLFVPDARAYVDVATGSPYPAGDVYGVNNSCLLTNDVVDVNVAVPGASVNLDYVTPTATLLPVGVIKTHDAVNPWVSQTVGVDIESMRGRFGTSNGRLAWLYNTFAGAFASICQVNGNPVITLDTPQAPTGSQFVNFLNLANNPLRSGHAKINFGLATAGRAQVKVYDVGGRLVRTLADRTFEAGPHSIIWDGVDDGGRSLARGVYFTQVKLVDGNVEMAKKLTILR